MASTSTPITIIVAATQALGIGANGGLPWRLREELAYFTRVTRRTTITATRQNAVIMGRTTWESLPPAYRPLPGRINVVMSRREKLDGGGGGGGGGAYLAGSMDEALSIIDSIGDGPGNKLFVIGGAQVYATALAHARTTNILFTNVLTEFDCDTFFPLDIRDPANGWVKKSYDELSALAGEEVPAGVQEENGVRYEFELYQKA
jgi:dihydrofolate reductase